MILMVLIFYRRIFNNVYCIIAKITYNTEMATYSCKTTYNTNIATFNYCLQYKKKQQQQKQQKTGGLNWKEV